MKTYEELLAERDALASQNKSLRDNLEIAVTIITCVDETGYMEDCGFVDVDSAVVKINELLQVTPQQCLAEIKTEAAEVAYYNGFKDALVIEPPLPPATCTSATIDVFAYRVDQASRYAASQYASKIRNAGTWLKDSNVNGGNRQGGEK